MCSLPPSLITKHADPSCSFACVHWHCLYLAGSVGTAGAIDLRNSIEQHYGLELPATLTFDYPTTTAIAGFLAERLQLSLPARSDPGSNGVTPYTNLATQERDSIVATAVVALSSRHPGPSLCATGFLQTLSELSDLQHVVPLSRWDIESVYSPGLQTSKSTVTTRFGAFCEDVEPFDSEAFRISASEATAMDPQTRQVMGIL